MPAMGSYQELTPEQMGKLFQEFLVDVFLAFAAFPAGFVMPPSRLAQTKHDSFRVIAGKIRIT
jgi:hypothetical protein